MLYIESSLFWLFKVKFFKNISIEKIRKIGIFLKGIVDGFAQNFWNFYIFSFKTRRDRKMCLSALLDLGYTMILGQNVYFK